MTTGSTSSIPFPDIAFCGFITQWTPGLFYFQPAKKRQIALMPRKKDADMKQVLGLLRYRGKLDGFTAVEIHDKSEAETAEILRDSMIFLSFSELEGWGLPPMEAMACGCSNT